MIDQLVAVHIRMIYNGSDITIGISAALSYCLVEVSGAVYQISIDV